MTWETATAVIKLDAATVLLQWATGGLAFGWVTTRRRQVGIGYGWLLRIVFGLMALGALATGRLGEPVAGRDAAALATAIAASVALVSSVVRRRAGVAAEHHRRQRRTARVAAMVGRPAAPAVGEVGTESVAEPIAKLSGRGSTSTADDAGAISADPPANEPTECVPPAPVRRAEFWPGLDLAAPALGVIGLVVAGLSSGGPPAVAVARTLVGAAFLGAVTDAMLLGHWYLTQPGLSREPLKELNTWLMALWPAEVALLLVPPGMLAVLSGQINDGWGGTLGWFWVACALTTIVLAVVTRAALRERSYSAVMAATGLLYLAILTAFGTDLVARAVLA
ncbi:MAG: hypothetical protein ACT4OS_00960 [Acidimicrobiales bacterium]